MFIREDTAGKESWYGLWYSGNRRVKRKIGPKRIAGTREGLTRAQAERELQRRVESDVPRPRSRLTIEEAGELYIEHVRDVLERKPTTISDYRSILRAHVVPFFGTRPLERIDADDLRRYLAAKQIEDSPRRAGKKLASKTIRNHLTFLHGLFSHAVKRGWVPANPVLAVDRPPASGADPDIRYLSLEDLETLLAAVPDDMVGKLERHLYLVAAMSGLRQGELAALRWMDVDWDAHRIRVRRNFTRQAFGTPKSRRSSRSVPMSARVEGALRGLQGESAYVGGEDLVFCHPQTGAPFDASKIRKRFKDALVRAGLRPARFHDLRHTFGTHCAAAGVPLRTLQEWLGHRDFKTTLIYADYAPSAHESALIERAFTEERDPARA